MKSVVLKPERERSLLRHHPWIFSGAVASEDETAAPGETVAVVAADGRRLAYGSYSPESKIRVRILSFDPDVEPDEAFIVSLVASAIGRRADFFANSYTNAIRLVNAESDGLPGVVADYYAGWVVCQFNSMCAEYWKKTVASALMKFAPFCQGVSVRADVKARRWEGLEMGTFYVMEGAEPPELIEIFEGPCKFLVDVRNGHKTGFYLDQREARATVGAFASGAEMLNCFAYTGGFGLFARQCGAASVTQVDLSHDALELAKKNEALVHLCGTKMEYIEYDVFKYLRKCRDERREFDMIVLDPPKFAEAHSQVVRAARGYKDINLLAMKLLRPNGILATFSCSGAMDEAFFAKILSEASTDAGRRFQILAKTNHCADHPVALGFPEGHYLKGFILRRV